jgi:hypothetical protein
MELPQSKINHFRVPIKKPEEWKIQAVAAFHQRIQEKKSASLKAKSAPHPEVQKKPSKKRNIQSVASADDSEIIKSEQVVANNPSSADILAEKQKKLCESLSELERLHLQNTVCKERVRNAHATKSQLIWLLKKAIAHERQMIHENLSEIASDNP